MQEQKTTKQTPLYEKHQELQARFIPFGEYEMPVWYKGIKEEHKAVRERVGIFDINHMGALSIKGEKRLASLNFLLTNDIQKLSVGEVQYNFACDDSGSILDDLLVYKKKNSVMLIVNCGKSEFLQSHFQKKNPHASNVSNVSSTQSTKIEDISLQTGLLSLQGPKSFDLCKKLLGIDPATIPYYSFQEISWQDKNFILSRTGYTGELGVEFFFDRKDNKWLWTTLLEEGKDFGIEPCGLGARDLLRLEMGFPLHGNDLLGRSPCDINKFWCVHLEKEDFVGKASIQKQKEEGIQTSLRGFVIHDRTPARHGYTVWKNDQKIGEVTSGGFSPTLQKGIGLCLIQKNEVQKDQSIEIEVRNRRVPASISKIPFVPNRTH